jgi:hypothetical protein
MSKQRGIAFLAFLTIGLAADAGAASAYLTEDNSTDYLMDKATATRIWSENVPERVRKLYPPRRWGLASEVEGGFNDAKTCVVTARAMILPVSASGRHLMYVPAKTAGAFDARPNATLEQCRELARVKLREAIQAVVFAISPR